MDLPVLTQFIQGWFHQDFDLDSEEPAVIAAKFRDTSNEETVQALQKEVDWLRTASNRSQIFAEKFGNDIELSGFEMTVGEFLAEIRTGLSN